MYIDELRENNDVTTKKAADILEKRIKSLKKRNIPDRMRRLLAILDHCDIGMVNGHLSTSGCVLSAFPLEMTALRMSLRIFNYEPRHNGDILREACLIFRTRNHGRKTKV